MKPGAQDALREVLGQADSVIAELLEKLQTVHDMRWVFIPGDKYLMLATVFDGTWDRYIDDFSTEAAPLFDALGAHVEGYPGTQSGDKLKDFIRSTQVNAELFAFAYPGRSVPEIHRALPVNDAFQNLLDASQS